MTVVLGRRRRAWLALGGAIIGMLALVQVTTIDPVVNVRWDASVSPADRATLERRFDLRNGSAIEGTATGWRYQLRNRSRENIRALVEDPAVDDTGNIDRDALTAPRRDIRVTVRSIPFPLDDQFDRPSQLMRLHQSLWLILAGGVLLSAARWAGARGRRNITVATLLFAGVTAVAFPIDPSSIVMGESRDRVASRAQFESYFTGRVRFEKHLSQTILVKVYDRLTPDAGAPGRALRILSAAAAVWFAVSALLIGVLEQWSVVVLRYLALALLAPATLLYFGWLELGYLSLNVAAFPLLVRGLRGGDARLEAGAALTGLGAALHGSGIVAIAGAWMAACGAAAPLKDRVTRAIRVAAWCTAAYLGWIAVYVIVLHMQVEPSPSAQATAWRPWSVDQVFAGRVNSALLSPTGMRDVLMEMWVAGVALLVLAVSLRRRYPHECRVALWYLPPSLLFLIFRWPFAGVGVGVDLVVAGFPAFYALAWVCAHEPKRTMIAAAILISAHLAFWRITLDDRFQNVVIDQHVARDS